MANKPRLSKAVLEMKFMKRTKEKVEKEDADAEGRAMYANEITEKMMHGSNFIIQPSYVFCENLINGRLSFRGMNPEIERLMELDDAALREKRLEQENQSKMKTDVNDDEMADYYGNVVQTMKKKFNKFSNRKRKADEMSVSSSSSTKTKFMKPKDE